jgi:predicted HTH domain antitoxin
MSQTLITHQQLEEQLIQQYRNQEIGLGKLAEVLGIHIMEAQQLLKKYNLDLQLTVEDFELEMAVLQSEHNRS